MSARTVFEVQFQWSDGTWAMHCVLPTLADAEQEVETRNQFDLCDFEENPDFGGVLRAFRILKVEKSVVKTYRAPRKEP